MSDIDVIRALIQAQEQDARDAAANARAESSCVHRGFLRGLAEGKRDVCFALRSVLPAVMPPPVGREPGVLDGYEILTNEAAVRLSLFTLAEVVDGSADWRREQVGALLRYIGNKQDALDGYPEVARLVEGARRREIKEAAHLSKCGVGAPGAVCPRCASIRIERCKDECYCHACECAF